MQDLTGGSLTGHLLKTTSFMLVSMVFQSLYVLIDLYWVGRLGTEAVAAVGISANLSFVVLAISQMLGVGTTTVVSHAAGRKEHSLATHLFNQSQVLSMVAGVIFLAIAMLFRSSYAAALSADATMQTLTGEYLLWFIPAMALQFAMVAMGAALRGTGNFKPGMIVQTGTVIINIVLAPVLIFGWGPFPAMGVSGAAVATFVAIVVGVIWLSYYFLDRDAYLRFHPADWRPKFRVWGQLLKIGLPAGVEFGFAVAPVAGQNFGARKGDRVRAVFKTAASIAAVTMLTLGVGIYLAAPLLVRLFSSDPEVIHVGVDYLHVVTINFVASGITFVSASMFQGMGNTLPSLATSALRMVVSIVPAIVLSHRPEFALTWIWWLTVVSTTLQMALNLVLLQREFRLKLA